MQGKTTRWQIFFGYLSAANLIAASFFGGQGNWEVVAAFGFSGAAMFVVRTLP